jgi:hypothetical protein
MALNPIADAIVKMEGADLPNSINMHMVRDYGLWNVGHIVWANQYGATKVWIGDRWWAGWPTREDSYAGLLRDLSAKARAGMTIGEAMYKYAPSKENNTENYIQYISQQTGWSRDTPLASILDGTVVPAGNSPASGQDTPPTDNDSDSNSGTPPGVNGDVGTANGGGGGGGGETISLDTSDPAFLAGAAIVAGILLASFMRH